MHVLKQTFRPRGPGRAAAAVLLSALTLTLLLSLVALPATHVQAATHAVNAADDVDDGACDGTHCSLREAINAANASAGEDIIAVGVEGPIVLLSGLPTVTDGNLLITGIGQRVSLTAPGTAFKVNADRVRLSDLIIDGEGIGAVGIEISGSTDYLVLESITVRGFTGNGVSSSEGGRHNAILDSAFTENGGNGIDLNGGGANTVQGNSITDNAGNGLQVANEGQLMVRSNTFSGNDDAQIHIAGMGPLQDMLIARNGITAGSDGIVVAAAVSGTAVIDIGLSVEDRNVFRGTIVWSEQHLKNLSAADINATYNDWDVYTLEAIEGVICHYKEGACGSGIVDYDPFIDTPMPLETPTATTTATETPGPPTATPEGGLPGDVETLGLIAGCNPLAWTGADGTPIGTIAGAVAPPELLDALWKYDIEAGGVWLGFSPQFPDVSDLTEMDRLDAVFVCVLGPGTFSRPVI